MTADWNPAIDGKGDLTTGVHTTIAKINALVSGQ